MFDPSQLKRVHHFPYFTARRVASTKPQLHMQRDAEAALQMNAALVENGFLLMDSVLNYPPDEEPELSYRGRFPVNLEGIAKGSYLLQTTRPPMNPRTTRRPTAAQTPRTVARAPANPTASE